MPSELSSKSDFLDAVGAHHAGTLENFPEKPDTASQRPKTATDSSLSGYITIQRPKSTPGMRHSRGKQSSKISRPKTAALILGRPECCRVQQLESEATRRHNLENHLGIKKNKQPPWQKMLESPMVPVVYGPGYIMSKSKSKYQVTIKDEFFNPVVDEQRKSFHGDPSRDSLISQLQQQISDLTLFLEEERLNHKQSKQNAEEFLRDKVDQLTTQHHNKMRELQEESQEVLAQRELTLKSEHKEIQDTMENQINRMSKEIEFLQSAFQSYQSSLHQETTDKWKAKEEELETLYSKEQEKAIHELRTKLTQEKNQDRNALIKEHGRAMEDAKKEHKKEIDSLIRRFANAAADQERLKKATEELQETKAELETVKESYEETCRQLTNTTRLLTDTKVRLMEFEERFQEKVEQVDDKYRSQLEEMMSQNTELKRLFVHKCEELFDEKNQADEKTVERVKTAKEAMETLIKSKERANVNMAVGGPADKKKGAKTRPSSAPGTREETTSAYTTAGEILPKLQEELIPPDLNLFSDPETEEMRAKLFSEPIREVTKIDLINNLDL